MTTTRPAMPVGPAAARVDLRRMLRLARLDLTLMWRNRTAMFGVLGIPAFFSAMLVVGSGNGNTTAGIDAVLYTGTGDLAFFLIFAVFIHLTTGFTARREELTLKRLRSGPLSDLEVLGGSVLGAVLMYFAQSAVLVVIIMAVLDGGPPADPVLLLAGMLGGAAVCALLATALSGVTSTAEMAQFTVLPMLLLSMGLSGFMFPLDGMPTAVQAVGQVAPLTPVVEILRTAYLGRDYTVGGDHGTLGLVEGWTVCVPSLLTLAAWGVVGAWLARRYFRWEPRRG
ncbi:ABC transporter permease [Thermomonospora cellulosilytica]|uniref:ABC-2 type transport system permease protein n=1 Tax=Thermomonospora cellulosilytica TaxID=1411118 RepID=A0A7W3RAL3_9ACTN|nr:ABC transporter permease [Thermomonospora cellulosilytica]MBA9006538.1 ABC-2 type transport system permease protein [Thermomonospora cellulosilytica]